MATPLTQEQFKAALPANVKKTVNQALIDQINKTLSDPEMYEQYRDNLLSYATVMKEGRFKLTSYLDAVKYVSYRMQDRTCIDAYSLTFPQKIQRFNAQKVSSKDIASYVSAYNKSKLVNLIMEQTLVPTWVLNQDMYQNALNHQAHLMCHARSEKVQSDAAAHIMNALRPPETKKVELDIGIKKDSSIEALRTTMQDLAKQQQEMMQTGAMTAQQIAHSELNIIEGETDDQ